MVRLERQKKAKSSLNLKSIRNLIVAIRAFLEIIVGDFGLENS